MKKIFVTGAAGFIGRHLVPTLLANGFDVTGLVRAKNEKGVLKGNSKIVVGDLSKNGQWQQVVKNHDVVVHLAAQISSKQKGDFEKNNVVATQNLVEAARGSKVKKIILFSSAAVTSVRQDWYSQTKKNQEEVVTNSKIDYVILRPSMIYGPGDNKNVGWLIKIIKRLPIIPLPGGGKFGRQPVYVDDICQIVLRLISNDYGQKIFEIHGYEYIPLSKMVREIVKKLGGSRLILPVPLFLLTVVFWVVERIFSNPKFTTDQIKSLISGEKFKGDAWWKIFGIMPTKFETGLLKMIKGN